MTFSSYFREVCNDFVGFFLCFVGCIELQNFRDRKRLLNIELESFIELNMGPTLGPGAYIELRRLLN
jgi:hypothetical protein